MNLLILSPEKEIFSGSVKSVKVPGSGGQFELLDRHAAIVSSLEKGQVRVILADGSRQNFSISGGFVEMLGNEVSLLVGSATE